MKESSPQLLAKTDTAAAAAEEPAEKEDATVTESFGSFVALRRLSKVQVEAVRMQGCADGVGCV